MAGSPPQAGLSAQIAHLRLGHGRQDRFPGCRCMGHFALPERRVEPDAAWSVDALDEYREAVVADSKPRRHLRKVRQLDEQRSAQFAERKLPSGDVAEPDRAGPERVPGTRLAIAEHPEGG